jgi:hypothetical protein
VAGSEAPNSAADHAATSSAAHRTVGETAREFPSHSVRWHWKRSGAAFLACPGRHKLGWAASVHSDEGGSAGLRRGLNLFGERRELRAGRHAGTDVRRPASPLAWHCAVKVSATPVEVGPSCRQRRWRTAKRAGSRGAAASDPFPAVRRAMARAVLTPQRGPPVLRRSTAPIVDSDWWRSCEQAKARLPKLGDVGRAPSSLLALVTDHDLPWSCGE